MQTMTTRVSHETAATTRGKAAPNSTPPPGALPPAPTPGTDAMWRPVETAPAVRPAAGVLCRPTGAATRQLAAVRHRRRVVCHHRHDNNSVDSITPRLSGKPDATAPKALVPSARRRHHVKAPKAHHGDATVAIHHHLQQRRVRPVRNPNRSPGGGGQHPKFLRRFRWRNAATMSRLCRTTGTLRRVTVQNTQCLLLPRSPSQPRQTVLVQDAARSTKTAQSHAAQRRRRSRRRSLTVLLLREGL